MQGGAGGRRRDGPARFDAVFVVSLCFAVLGLAVLLLLADGRPGARRDAPVVDGADDPPPERAIEHVYVVRADGGGSPHRVVARASSPVGIE